MASPKQRTFTLSNFRRVRNTENRYDDMGTDTLAGLSNGYMPDPVGGGGAYQRPGTVAMTAVSSANDGQGVYCHTAPDGTNYNFLFIGGKVYRQSTDLTSAPVDVTPLNVTISTTARIYATSLDDQMIVNDGENVPWLGSSLGSTPIVATVIEYTPQTGNGGTGEVLRAGTTDTQIRAQALYALFNDDFMVRFTPASGVALPAGTIPINTWGVYRVSVDDSVGDGVFTVTAGAANYTTGYASETAAISAAPATPNGEWNVGYFTVQTGTGVTFVAGTDALAGGASGNPANATNYYPGQGFPWTAYGQPVIYTGAVFFILNRVTDSILQLLSARTTITWSEPNQPAIGYQQADYDNNWTLTQTSTEPLYALAPTNDALYYFRALSIGAITGAPNINFQNTATHDVVSANIGCVSPATVATFLNYVYFTDANGRPQRFAIGGAPEPIWLQAQQSFESGALTSVASSMWAVIEPNLNVYIVGRPTVATWFVFDANTGIYMGTWHGGAAYVPVIGGVLQDASAIPQLVTLSASSGSSVSVRKLARVQDAVWTDAGAQMAITWTTGFVGYNIGTTYTIPRVRAEISSGTTPTVTATFTTTAQSVVGATATTSGTGSGGFSRRFTWMTDTLVGRGVQVAITVTGGSTQIKMYAISIEAVEQGDALTDDR